MSNLFGNPYNNPKMQRNQLVSSFNAARSNLLLIIVFTAINLLMLATNSGTYFLFSASVPYILTDISMFFCGMYPAEYYEGFEGMFFFNKSFFVIMLVISILILAVYLLCWIFSKKNKVGWLITSLVMFSFDTLVMFLYYGISADMIIDIVFHIWAIVLLVMGIRAHYKLKKMTAEKVMIEGEFNEVADENESTESTESENTDPDEIEDAREKDGENNGETISDEIKKDENTEN